MRVILPVLVLAAANGSAWAQSVVVGNGATETVGAGVQLVVPAEGVQVQSGGALAFVGDANTSDNTRGRFLGPTSGAPITVQSGGSIRFKFAKVENVTTLTVSSGGRLLQAHECQFIDLVGMTPGAAPWIDVSAHTDSDRDNLAFSMNHLQFTDNQGTPTRTNVKAGVATPLLRIHGYSNGNRYGASYETDPSGRIVWASDAVKRYNGGVYEASFPTLHAALADPGSTSGKRIKVDLGPMAFIAESIDWSDPAYGGRPDSAGPTVESVHIGSLAPDATGAAYERAFWNSGAGPKGVIVRSVIVHGGMAGTTAKNCTIYDPTNRSVDITNVVGTNLLVECDHSGTGNSLTTCLETAHAPYFYSPATYNLHLVAPAALPAIDEGTALTFYQNLDIDNEIYGSDGKPLGSGAWDIGADEYVPVGSPVLNVNARTTTSISWTIGPVQNEVGFHFVKAGHTDNDSPVVVLPADTTSYSDTGLSENTAYIRHVHGYTLAYDWPAQADRIVYTSIHDPTGSDFQVIPGATSALVLITPPPNGSSGYTAVQIDRSPDGTSGWVTVKPMSPVYTYVDAGIAAQTWYYRIQFRNGDAILTATSAALSTVVGSSVLTPTITTPSKKSNDNTPQIAGTSEPNIQVEVWMGSVSLGLTSANGSGAWSIHNVALPFADGVYVVVAKAKNGGLYSDPSSSITFEVDTTAPPPVQDVSVVQLNGKLVVQWRASGAADLKGYNVYRSSSPSGPWTLLTTPNPVRKDQIQYYDSVGNGTYYYKVTALDDALNEKH